MNLCNNTGLVIEGGGFRAIFTAAVLEAMHQHQLFFPYAIGVSAGAAYGVSYVSRQSGRNLETNRLINHPDYCGWNHWIKRKNFFNWEFIYKTIPTKIILLDYITLKNSTTHFQVAVTNCITARPEYLDANTANPELLRDLLTATSSLPYVATMKTIQDIPYFDGGLSDPIPVNHALSVGNKRLVLILTRPKGYQKNPSEMGWLFKRVYKKFPELVKIMQQREEQYNKILREIEQLEADRTVFVIRPAEPIPIGRLENNPKNLEKYYTSALYKMDPVMENLKSWLSNP